MIETLLGTLWTLSVIAVLCGGCGLITMKMANRRGLDRRRCFIVGAVFLFSAVLIVWMLEKDHLTDKNPDSLSSRWRRF